VAESFEMRALVTGAVGRFVSRTAHAALARWLAWTIDRGERRTLAKRAVSWRMGHLKTAALERWYAWCNDRKEQRALVKTAVYWRMGRVKTETVLRWRDALVDAQVRVAFPKSNDCLHNTDNFFYFMSQCPGSGGRRESPTPTQWPTRVQIWYQATNRLKSPKIKTTSSTSGKEEALPPVSPRKRRSTLQRLRGRSRRATPRRRRRRRLRRRREAAPCAWYSSTWT
jgi:hypothetical protein